MPQEEHTVSDATSEVLKEGERRPPACFFETVPDGCTAPVVRVTDAGRHDIVARGDRHLIARLDAHVLSHDSYVTIGCINGDAGESVDIHRAQRRLDVDVTVMGTHFNLIDAIAVTDMDTTRQLLGVGDAGEGQERSPELHTGVQTIDELVAIFRVAEGDVVAVG